MTTGLAAGPYGNPNRPRPLDWKTDSANYSFERPVSTYNTAFSYVAQLRNYLPDEIGGIAWYGVDDTYTSCYFPIYCQSATIPEPFATGDINQYSNESAWWAFNFAANFANIRYADMVKDIRSVQQKLELQFVEIQVAIERAAMGLDKDQRIAFLNAYTTNAGLSVHNHWVELGRYLVTKYNDGYVKDSMFRIHSIGYPREWLEQLIKDDPGKYLIPEK
jgi:dipeptidase